MLKKLFQSLMGHRSSSHHYRKYSSSDVKYSKSHQPHNGYGHSHYGHSHYKKKHSSRSFFSS
ncbi:MAG: hypothetical protein ACM32O_16800 [Clostridia bacterium]